MKVAALSHVMFTTGLRVPAEEIVAAAHEVGALVLYDGAQTAGHIAMDFTAMSVELLRHVGPEVAAGADGQRRVLRASRPEGAAEAVATTTRRGIPAGAGAVRAGVAGRCGARRVRGGGAHPPRTWAGARRGAHPRAGVGAARGVGGHRRGQHQWACRRSDGVRDHGDQRGGLGRPRRSSRRCGRRTGSWRAPWGIPRGCGSARRRSTTRATWSARSRR